MSRCQKLPLDFNTGTGNCAGSCAAVRRSVCFLKVLREHNGERKTAIERQARKDGRLVLQGFEGERAWSASIQETTGKLSVSATGEAGGFLVFGVCTGL